MTNVMFGSVWGTLYHNSYKEFECGTIILDSLLEFASGAKTSMKVFSHMPAFGMNRLASLKFELHMVQLL